MPIPRFRSIWLAVALTLSASMAQASGDAAPVAQAAAGTAREAVDLDSLKKQALEEGQAGKTDDAIRDYQRALQLDSGWKEGLWNLGMLQYSSDRFAEAKDTFQKVAGFAPSLGIAWSLLGLSEYETGDLGDSLTHLEKAQALGVKDDEEIARVSSYHLGLLWIRAGEFERASALLLSTFGAGNVSPQAKIALGLAILRVPLLPEQLDPSREALLLAAGEAAIAGADEPPRLAALLREHPDLPYLHYAYGLALAGAGRENEARQQMLAETRISPLSPLPWMELSRLNIGLGEASESVEAAQQAVRTAPENQDAHGVLAQALESAGRAEQAAAERQFVAPGSGGKLIAEQRMILLYANSAAKTEAGPGAIDRRWSRAMSEYSAGQYAAAIPDLKAWLAATPENGTGWALLGLCEFALKDFDNALIHLDRGAKLGLSASSESLYQARYTFGILLVHAGQFDRAADVLSSASKATGPLAQKVENALGLVLLRRAEFPEAESPSETPLVNAAGHVESLLLQSKYDEAFPQLKLLLDRYPSTPFLHYAYGTALIALSHFDEASVQMLAERPISQASELPCVRLASIALRQHDSAAAITWSQQALQLAPNAVDAHYLLGRASLEAGDLLAAIRELEIAGKLSPASPEVHFNLAKAYARAKMPEKAEQEREIFSRLNAAEENHPGSQGAPGYAGPRQPGKDANSSPANGPAAPRLQ
jgi:tetratricopeptide (TPR) repeat protein